jgi:hypothetical protein
VKRLFLSVVAITILIHHAAGKTAEQRLGPLTVNDRASVQPGGYLFAHMTGQDYGRLYYSVSKDALNWTILNNAKRISDQYRGHPSLCKGHDSRYYMTGGSQEITLWVSDDLVTWRKHGDLRPDVDNVPDFEPAEHTYGASKIYYDTATSRYLITWHTSQNAKLREEPEHYWTGQRTLYIISKDLREFTQPRRLFQFDMATIDVIVHRIDDRYYAILKDEKYPSFDWPTGKTIRISSSDNLTGPWTPPSDPITANFREAPTLIPRPDAKGWYLYCEQYPGIQYNCLTAPKPTGPWYDLWITKYKIPENARHGSMIPIGNKEYSAIMSAYADSAASPAPAAK